MNIALFILCLCICLADVTQVVIGPIRAGPILGACLYAILGLGVHRRHRPTYIILIVLPIIPITALGLSWTGIVSITTPWTLPIFALQMAAACIAGRILFIKQRQHPEVQISKNIC